MAGIVKAVILVFLSGLFIDSPFAQAIIPTEIASASARGKAGADNLCEGDRHETLPQGFEEEALSALAHFPELSRTAIRFRVKKSFSTLKTRPTVFSMIKPRGHRSYVIIISNKTINKLTPVILGNLPEEARIGVIGHELSHVADFSSATVWQSIKMAFGHLSKHYLDSLEFHTDLICIHHGLGKELKAWSSYVRNTLNTTYWRGSDYVNKGDDHYERYMNPSTIDKYMAQRQDSSNTPLP